MTNTKRSDGTPEPDGTLRVVTRKKILHYCQLYLDHPETIAFMSSIVHASDGIYSGYYSCMITVKHHLYLTKYRRNRVNFLFFTLLV